MRTVGFVISKKENEKRRAILPEQIALLKNKQYLFFEQGYGEVLGYSDQQYINAGVNIVSRDEALSKDIICDPKIGDAQYLKDLKEGQLIFGWVHSVQNKSITDILVENKISALAWEDMFESGRHVFWRNNELAGEAAIMHAFTLFGKLPYDCKVAIIGKGNIARGAYRILSALGAEIKVYDKRMEQLLRDEISEFDVIVNGILWDVDREDHILNREDLLKMKSTSMIVDISCDRNGAIETSIPTTIEDPIYYCEGVLHYVVDHTPALVSHTVSKTLGDEVVKYLDLIIENIDLSFNETLHNALIIERGNILDNRINLFQKRNELV